MKVTSLELSKQIYAAFPSWSGTERVWREHLPNPLLNRTIHRADYEYDRQRFNSKFDPGQIRFRQENKFYSAYDIDYLLDKLPAVVGRNNNFSLTLHKWSALTWHASYLPFDNSTTLSHLYFTEGTTPAEALGLLVLELKKAGIEI